jgi:hypothetical protein
MAITAARHNEITALKDLYFIVDILSGKVETASS